MKTFLSKQLKEIMRPPHKIRDNRPVRELVNLFLNHKINEAIVVDALNFPEGVVTKTDIIRHSVQFINHKTKTEAYRRTEEGELIPLMPREAELLEVKRIMSPKIFSLSENSTVGEALALMIQEDFKRIFVHQDQASQVVGVVGIRELLRSIRTCGKPKK